MLLTALIMGLTGSLHCAGMCSPLVLAVTGNAAMMRSRLIYNAGRILTYIMLGTLAGSVGNLFAFDHFRSSLSIAMGIALLILSLTGFTNVRIPVVHTLASKLLLKLKAVFGTVLRRRTAGSVFLLGTLNGILPCGLTFAALLVALALGTVQSALFMLAFGLGTLPVMIGLTSGVHYVMKHTRLSVGRIASIMLFVSGCLLIARTIGVHDGTRHEEKQGVVDVVLCR